MKVNEIMSSRVICIRQDEPVSAAAKLLKRSNVGALPVCDANRRLRGIVTDRDIVTRCIALDADPAQTRVAEIMSRGVVTASPLDETAQAARIMRTDQVRRLPVFSRGDGRRNEIAPPLCKFLRVNAVCAAIFAQFQFAHEGCFDKDIELLFKRS